MNSTRIARKGLMFAGYASLVGFAIAISATTAFAQTAPKRPTKMVQQLPPLIQKALDDTDKASQAKLQEFERRWRELFCEARSRTNLQGFVNDSLDLFEKVQQLGDVVSGNSSSTEQRIAKLFRTRILDEAALCDLMERDLQRLCRSFDELDRALFIKLKIDADVRPTGVSREAIHAGMAAIRQVSVAATQAVKKDLPRAVASFIGSNALGIAAAQAAQDAGMAPGEEGSMLNTLFGFAIGYGIDKLVDAATLPTETMIADLDAHLKVAEEEILEGTDRSPGVVRDLREHLKTRASARQQLFEAVYRK